MTSKKLWTWAMAAAVVYAAGCVYMLDQPSELQAMRDVSAAKDDAIKEQRHALEIARRCYQERGPNSSWVETPDGGYRCTDKRGKAGAKVMLADGGVR